MSDREIASLSKAMTAADVIQQIEKLPREERAKVIEFARSAAQRKRLSPEEIGEICEKMQNAKDPAEADRLEEELIEGFYGEEQLCAAGALQHDSAR